MRCLLICMIALFSYQLNGQITKKVHPLSPAQGIALSKQNGISSRHVELFTTGNKNAATKNRQVPQGHQLLKLVEREAEVVRMEQPETIDMSIPARDGVIIDVELFKVDLVSEDFKVRTSSGKEFGKNDLETAAFYRGIVDGDPSSIASLSMTKQELVGMFSSPTIGNLSLEEDPFSDGDYIINHEKDGTKLEEFYCQVPDVGEGYSLSETIDEPTQAAEVKCTKIYFEVDYDIFKDKGSIEEVVSYVTGLFNEVAAIYANENVKIEISEIFIWDSASPYRGGSSLEMLQTFQTVRTSFNGDLAQLLSYQSSGGIAVVSGLCHPVTAAKMSFSSVSSKFNQFPNYSWSVLVVAHELGHLFGSMHTHACVWNGNNTAIDGCPGFVEGSCSNNKGIPSEGGTIMSYCHLTSAGTNFSLGFGPQPGNVIRNRVASASCLEVCAEEEDPNTGSEEEDPNNGEDPASDGSLSSLTYKLALDDYPMEVVWYVVDENGKEWYSGGPYEKKYSNQVITETFQLPAGNYKHIIEDYYGDGICCKFGDGYFLIRGEDETLLASGSQFSDQKISPFTIGSKEEDPPVEDVQCIQVNFSDYEITGYGGVQDKGNHLVVHSGNTLVLKNSAWKAIHLDVTITAETVLRFDFASTQEGDIHAIGFDSDEVPSGSQTFQLFGVQKWGLQDHNDYEGNSVWKTYQIPVGQFYTGKMDRLFVICDDDFGSPKGDAYFRNMQIFNGRECESELRAGDQFGELPSMIETEANSAGNHLKIVPNPAKESVGLQFKSTNHGEGMVTIYNILQQAVLRQEAHIEYGFNEIGITLPDSPPGTYVAEVKLNGESWVEKIEIIP